MSTPHTTGGREFLIGVILSAWFLSSAHGEDAYAQELLLETVGASGIDTLRRIAGREQYQFRRGFWAELKRKATT